MKRAFNTYVVYPVKPLRGILYGNSFDDIQVVKEVGNYDPKHKVFKGYVPVLRSSWERQLHYASPLQTLSELIYQAERIGVNTLILIRRNDEKLSLYLQKLAKSEGKILDIDAVKQKHMQFVDSLCKHFRVIEIDEEDIIDLLAKHFQEYEDELSVAISMQDIDKIQEIAIKVIQIELALDNIPSVHIHPHHAVKLMLKAVETENPFARFNKQVVKYALVLSISFLFSFGVMPIVIKPLVAKIMPTPQRMMIQTITAPELDDIKGMYLPPVKYHTATDFINLP